MINQYKVTPYMNNHICSENEHNAITKPVILWLILTVFCECAHSCSKAELQYLHDCQDCLCGGENCEAL